MVNLGDAISSATPSRPSLILASGKFRLSLVTRPRLPKAYNAQLNQQLSVYAYERLLYMAKHAVVISRKGPGIGRLSAHVAYRTRKNWRL